MAYLPTINTNNRVDSEALIYQGFLRIPTNRLGCSYVV